MPNGDQQKVEEVDLEKQDGAFHVLRSGEAAAPFDIAPMFVSLGLEPSAFKNEVGGTAG